MFLLDDLAYASPWRRRHPAEKIFLTLGMLSVTLTATAWVTHTIVLAAMAGCALFGAGVRLKTYLGIMLLPAAFLAMSALTLIISLDLSGGGFPGVQLSYQSLPRALGVSLRALSAFSCLILLSVSTPLPEMLFFLRRCGLPELLLDISLLTYNMCGVFLEAVARMKLAQEVRLGYSSLKRSYHSLGHLAANLFVQAMHRAKSLETGLASRGFHGDLKVLVAFAPLSVMNIILTALALPAIPLASYLLMLI